MTDASEKRGRGRPSLYTEELAAEIVQRLSAGEPLADICRDDHMPAVRTVSHWKQANAGFSADFAHARDVGYDAIATRSRRTARGFGPDLDGDSTGDVQRDKLIIDTDLKLLAKWSPKRYGEKVALVGGDEDDSPIRTSEEIDGRIIALLARHGLAEAADLGEDGAAEAPRGEGEED